jgi:adenylate cyclase
VTRRLQAEREQAWIRHAFSSYVSPNLVQHLIEHPDELRLGGERRECSFVMSDLAGFTALVEASEPETLLALLNEYLDGMLAIAFRHDGTLDRIVGDAVAVMFGAPVAQPDHAARAIACAREMDEFARAFSAEKRAAGVALGNTRIGVHSGAVIVGNVGGRNVLDYRPLGDAINTAARLESVNRHLGTRLCVSGDTARLCPDFVGRPVGTLVLKGKTQGVPAFEPATPEAAEAPRFARYMAAFGLMERDDPAAIDAFAYLVAEAPEDGLAAFHLERLRRGERGSLIVLGEK